ncbi:hypothetical protein SDJN03_30059, partial [Cucurbita argyrosperma subsp. sororia]
MSAMVESWMSELGKWKNRVEAQKKKKPLMPKSNQFLQNDVVSAHSDDTETERERETTICLLIDRFAPSVNQLIFCFCPPPPPPPSLHDAAAVLHFSGRQRWWLPKVLAFSCPEKSKTVELCVYFYFNLFF